MGKIINPVELLILLSVASGFGLSVYRLFHMGPQASLIENREPASITPALGHIESTCKPGQTATIPFSKVRISGPICGAPGSSETDAIQGASVLNSANQFQATVFTDVKSGSFSTDYIPLNLEQNLIRLEFKFKTGRTVSHTITLKKE